MANVGRIGFVIEGDFNPSKPYKELSVIKFETATYVVKTPTLAGQTPTSHPLKFMKVAENGKDFKFTDLTTAQKTELKGADGSVWTENYSLEEDGLRILRKVISYVGGTGTLPTALTANVGKYYAKTGGFTSVKADATDFKGSGSSELSPLYFPLVKIPSTFISASNGVSGTNASFVTYDWIAVKPGETYLINGSNTSSIGSSIIAFYKYKNEATYISSIPAPLGSNVVNSPVVIPTGANYIRIAGQTALNITLSTNVQGLMNLAERANQIALDATFEIKDYIPVPAFIDVIVGRENVLFLDQITPNSMDLNNGVFTIEGLPGNAYLRENSSIKYNPSAVIANKELIFKKFSFDFERILTSSKSTIRTIPKNGGTGQDVNICIVGDSLTDNESTASEVYKLLNQDGDYVFNQIGTRGTLAKHEGRSGWKWETYLLTPNVLLNSGDIDLRNYLNVNFASLARKEIDFMSICLGTNDIGQTPTKLITESYILSVHTKIKQFIDSAVSSSKGFPNMKIQLGLIPVGTPYATTFTGSIFKRNAQLYNRILVEVFDNGKYHPNVTCSLYALSIDGTNNYPKNTEPVSEYNTGITTIFSTNQIHPTPIGYNQFGRGLYNRFRAFLNGKL